MQRRPAGSHISEPPLPAGGGFTAAALIMHKWVVGWHTPDMQSEFILQLAPTTPLIDFVMQRSSGPLQAAGVRPHSELSPQLELGCRDEAALSMHN